MFEVATVVAGLFAARSRAYTCRWPELEVAGLQRPEFVRGEEPRLHLPAAGFGSANRRL
jgi:hypothetical protein